MWHSLNVDVKVFPSSQVEDLVSVMLRTTLVTGSKEIHILHNVYKFRSGPMTLQIYKLLPGFVLQKLILEQLSVSFVHHVIGKHPKKRRVTLYFV